jgi:hypothetical protein
MRSIVAVFSSAMAEAVPLTLVVEDSQPPEYYPDNQEGLEDSQRGTVDRKS